MGRSRKKKRGRQTARRAKGGGRSLIPPALRRAAGLRLAAGCGSRKKLSAAILELIAPFRDEAPDFSASQALVAIGCLAWNLSLVPHLERTAREEEAARTLPSAERKLFHEIIDALISRKQRLFPEDCRMVVSHEIATTEKGVELLVASAPMDP